MTLNTKKQLSEARKLLYKLVSENAELNAELSYLDNYCEWLEKEYEQMKQLNAVNGMYIELLEGKLVKS